MFLTTHSVFEQLLLYDHRTSESADRGGRTTAERSEEHGAWVECLGRPGAAPV